MCSIVRNNGPTAVKSPVEEMLRYIDSLPDDPPKAKVEIRTRKFWAAVWSEFLATLLLIVVTSPSTGEVDVRQSLAVGASAALLTYTLQGAAFNPAVSIPRCLVGRSSLLKLFASVLAQAFGAVLGSLLVFALQSEGNQPLIETKLHLSQVFAVEFLGSFVVVLTVLTSDDDVESGLMKFQAFPVGLAYGAATLFSFSHTGVGLNPVRALGQVLVARNWTNHWVYWIGPLLGGLIGGFTYDYARSSRKDVQEQAERTSRQRELDRERGLRRGLSALSQDTEMTNSLNTNDCRV